MEKLQKGSQMTVPSRFQPLSQCECRDNLCICCEEVWVCENPKVGQKGFYNLGWEQARSFTGFLLHPDFQLWRAGISRTGQHGDGFEGPAGRWTWVERDRRGLLLDQATGCSSRLPAVSGRQKPIPPHTP